MKVHGYHRDARGAPLWSAGSFPDESAESRHTHSGDMLHLFCSRLQWYGLAATLELSRRYKCRVYTWRELSELLVPVNFRQVGRVLLEKPS